MAHSLLLCLHNTPTPLPNFIYPHTTMTHNDDSDPVVEVLPPVMQEKPHSPIHVRNEDVASQVRDLGRLGLSKGNAAIAVRLTPYLLDKYYLEDYLEGVTQMQRGLASVAIAEAMNGNTPILLHLLKTKLGWSEQQIVEHVGEIRAVVSSKPMSKEEFVQKYLNKSDE